MPILHPALFTAGGPAWMEAVPQGDLTQLSLTKSPTSVPTPPPPPILWSFTGYKAREIDCTHILSQVYLLLFLYGSHIGKKHIYITWRVILFFSRCLSREGGEQGHACVCARMLAAGDALVLLSQVKYLHLCMSLPSSQWKGALILSWAGERQCENKKLHRQEFFSTTATGSNILNIVCLSN